MEISKRTSPPDPTTFPYPSKIIPGFLNAQLPASALVYPCVLFLHVSWITRPPLLINRRAAPGRWAQLPERYTCPRKPHHPGEGKVAWSTHHFNYMHNKRRHLSCQMEEKRQISNYPPPCSSWLILRRNSGWLMMLGAQKSAHNSGSPRKGAPIHPQPAASCSPPTVWGFLLFI